MFKNYLKVAFRNLNKNRAYALINILGLALGLMVSIIVYLYVVDELSYEKHIDNYENIYRVGIQANMTGLDLNAPVSCDPMAESLRHDFPEVINATRMRPVRQEILLNHEGNKLYVDKAAYADSNFFQIFNFAFIHGDPNTALKEENGIVLTEETSQKFFGDENPMGKIINYDNRRDYIVRGVIAEPAGKSHFSFNYYLGSNTSRPIWISNNNYTYFELRDNVDPKAFNAKMSEKFLTYIAPDVERFMQITIEEFLASGNTFDYDMNPIQSIHLHSQRDWEIEQNSNIMYIYIFIAIALLVLLIAGINFMNLATARSAKRAKEVGIRKVSGATRSMLVTQFLIESIVQSLIALFLAFTLSELLITGFNNVMQTDLSLINQDFGKTLGFAIIVTLIYGLFSGSYPAFFLSALQPVKILKGDMSKTKGGSLFRKVLVVTQFAASIILIIGMSIIFMQINYMHNKNLGFNGDEVLVVPVQTDDVAENFETYKQEFLTIPNVLGVARSSYLPGGTPNQNMYKIEGIDDHLPFWNMSVDYDFFETLDLQLAEGKMFDRNIDSDSTYNYIVNETAVKNFNLENVIGRQITDFFDGTNVRKGSIIGVVKDFHIEGFNQPIKPVLLNIDKQLWWVSMKVAPNNMNATIAHIEETWNEMEPSHPFRYTFLDENFGALYKQQENFGTIFLYLTILAIIISCMGLYGLAAFTTEQRTKEIGIRKVLGASVSQLMTMLSKDFLKLVILANLFAWPISVLLVKKWLAGFSYQIALPIMPFILASLAALIIAMITVSHQAYLASYSDPVKALKYE